MPVPGDVLVRAGQRVEPSDVVAQSTLAAEPVPVHIASDMDMTPQAAAKRLLVSIGQVVERGATLAQKGGFGSRSSRAPVSGTFTGYDPATGMGQITTPAEPVSVQAHIKGIVTDLIPYYGAVIESPATLIRGIFGVGGEQHGVLKVTVTGNDDPLTPEAVDARVAYAIVLGGAEVTAEALRRLILLGARGVITGGIRSDELADFLGYTNTDKARQQPSPGPWSLAPGAWNFPPLNPGAPSPVPPDFVLVVTEGFGPVPMSPRTFELLAAYDGQEIAIDGTTRLRGGLMRPEIIIPLARTTSVRWLGEGPKLEVGVQVRLLAPDYLGQIAQVTGLPTGPRATQSGVVAPVADVLLGGDRRLRVPIVDLEVLE